MISEISYEKYYVDKSLSGLVLHCKEDHFQYRSMKELGTHVFEGVLDLVLSETKSRDLQARKGKDELRRLIELAENEFYPENWYIAFLGNDPIGLILPQKFPDSLKEGTLYVIGIVPQFRQKGFSKILHIKGLQILISLGINRYVGSTDVGNSAMIKVFSANGCNYLGVRQLDKNGNHIGWRDRPRK